MKKRLLKSISAIAVISILTFQSVSAITYNTSSGLNTDTSVITVKGETDNKLPDRPVSIDITIGDTTIYADQVLTNENGAFDVKVKIPEGTNSGSLVVKTRGYLEAASTTLLPAPWYASPVELEQLLKDLNDGTKSLEDVLSDLENADFINLNIQLSCWESRLAEDVAELLEGVKFTSAGDIKEKVYTAAVITLIREKDADEAVDFLKETDDGGKRISLLKLDEQAEELFLSDNKIALFAANNMDKKCDTAIEFIEDFEKKIAVGTVNEAESWGNLNKRLEECAELLGLDEYEDAFEEFSTDSEIAADTGKALMKKLPFTDAESLGTAFKNAVDAAGKDEDDDKKSTSSGRGGSSGGGGGSMIATSGKGNENNNTDTNENSNIEQASYYNDVADSHWAYSSIMSMTQEGIISGDGSGAFYPENAVTREEFVKMLVLAIGLDITEPKETPYTDVSADDWFYPYVAAAREKGLVLGVSETAFGTGDIITREQMAAICYRAAEMTGRKFSTGEAAEFSDAASISNYAKEAVQTLASGGILKGMEDNSFVPQGEVTRAQAAHVIFNIYRTEGA